MLTILSPYQVLGPVLLFCIFLAKILFQQSFELILFTFDYGVYFWSTTTLLRLNKNLNSHANVNVNDDFCLVQNNFMSINAFHYRSKSFQNWLNELMIIVDLILFRAHCFYVIQLKLATQSMKLQLENEYWIGSIVDCDTMQNIFFFKSRLWKEFKKSFKSLKSH